MLRKETVEPATLGLLKKIVAIPELSQFRLVGGTALSLLLGHRKSIDIDLFTDKPFDRECLLSILDDNFNIVTPRGFALKSIVQCEIDKVKVDFVSIKDPFIHPVKVIENIPFADIRDIAGLKLNAVKGRGAKKDFWDVDRLLREFSMENLLQFYQDRYPYDDTFAVLLSITYFTNADKDADPEMVEKTTWVKIKKNIKRAFDNYYKNYK